MDTMNGETMSSASAVQYPELSPASAPRAGCNDCGLQAAAGATAVEYRHSMPEGGMGTDEGGTGGAGMGGASDDNMTMDGTTRARSILIELRAPAHASPEAAMSFAQGISAAGMRLDASYTPIAMTSTDTTASAMQARGEQGVLVRAFVDPDRTEEVKRELEARPDVIAVWDDTPIAPFVTTMGETLGVGGNVQLDPSAAPADCPIPPCDCSPGVAKGTIADVARYLGCDAVWERGIRGQGMVVGIVDGGITAQGRVSGGQITNVIGGYPTNNWGTIAAWGGHGNMTATDAKGMAPEARVYDIRISDAGSTAGTISAALAGFDWAIQQHRRDGTPQVLSNSWGIFQAAWDQAYATNPNHPFTRKVVQALDEGILVVFAAGNCGKTCPDGRCGSDTGPGRDIWGANGHPRVMTVGAVNIREQFIGYSSQGPAALDPNKPDFCAPSHFRGFFESDSGTSAACPVTAGVITLLKQANPALTQDQIKAALRATAKNIGPAGFDRHSGAGIIRAREAFAQIAPRREWKNWENLGGTCIHGVGACAWSANRLDVFVTGSNSHLYHKWWDGGAWRGFEDLGGTIISAPAAVSWGPNRIDTFAIGTNSRLYHKWWDGRAWRGFEDLGGTCIQGVDVASWAPNRLDVFVTGTDSRVYHKWWDGAAWRGFEDLGGTIISAPAAVSWGPNRIDIFAIGTNSQLYHKWWNGQQWSGWESLGGTCIQGVTAASWAANRLDVFVTGAGSQLYHKWWNGQQWSGWENLGGTIISAPAAVSWGPGRIDTFAIGTNSQLYRKYYGGSPAFAAQEPMASVSAPEPMPIATAA